MGTSMLLRKLLFTLSFAVFSALFCNPSTFAMENNIESDSLKCRGVQIMASFPTEYNEGKNAEIPAQPTPVVDILSATEEEQMQFLKQTFFLGAAIYNTKTEERLDLFTREVPKIDSRCFLLPAETVRKWYYTLTTFEKIAPEDYEGLDKATLKSFIFDKYFNFPTDPEKRLSYYRNNSIGFLNQELIGCILKAAHRILSFATAKDRVIIFGNTPYFVGRTIEFLTGEKQKLDATYQPPKLIYLPFSGAPNTKSARNFSGYNNDIVTLDRLAHFQSRLNKLGLSSDNHDLLEGTTYIVDEIGAGSGPAFTMETILRQYVKGSAAIFPAFEVISLNFFSKKHPQHMAIASFPAEDGDNLELSFPCKENPFFKVPARVIFLPGHKNLDVGPDIAPYMRMVPKYNPCYWSEEFDYLLSAPRTELQEIIEEYFQENLRALVENGHPIM